MLTAQGYNERLFSGAGLRNYYHLARYRWLRKRLTEHSPQPLKIIELGCFDGKAVHFIPHPIERYVGLDAGWENGLEMGRNAFAGRPEISLVRALDADAIADYDNGEFNVAIALETLEHIPTQTMRGYLAEVARVTNGPFFVSVPNEMGPVFLAKYLAKRLRYGAYDQYSFREAVAATLRRPEKIERAEHKGFDYRALIGDLREHFHVDRVEGVPACGLPPALSLTIGITARSGVGIR